MTNIGLNIFLINPGAGTWFIGRASAHGEVSRRIDLIVDMSLQSVLHNWCKKGRGLY